MKRLIKIGYIAVIAVTLMAPLLSFAALPNPSIPVGGNAVTLAEVEDRIVQVARFLITISLIVAVGSIIVGAIYYMTAGDSKRNETGKKYLTNGLWGAAIVLAVGVLLQTLAGLITRSFFN